MKHLRPVCVITLALLLAFNALPSFAYTSAKCGQQQSRPDTLKVTLKGRVVEARSGEPVAKVKVRVVGSDASATTDENGVFTLDNIQPGEVDLYITTVGFGLVKKTITVKDGENAEVEIVLNQEGAMLTEKVTVSAGPYEETETNAASEQTLNKIELQTLSMVLVGDPLRASQALPGVAANNDLRSEFAVRGAGYERIGIFVDGILTDNFVHTTVIDNDTDNKLSLSVINSDTISGVSLMSGAFPVKYGDSTAAILNLETRDGNRVKPSGRFATGLLATSGVVDGPFANKRGSWLVAARTSYVDYLQRLVENITNTDQIDEDDESGSINFTDFQSKVVYDLSPRHHLGVSAIYGIFLGKDPDSDNRADPNNLSRIELDNLLVNANWTYTPNARTLAQTRVFVIETNSDTSNRDRLIIENRDRAQLGLRSDVSFLVGSAQRVEAGLYARRMRAEKTSNFFPLAQPTAPLLLEAFDRRAVEQSYYLQDTWHSERHGVSVTGGGRIEHSGLTGETLFSPRAAFALATGGGWRFRAGVGRYYQFPDFQQLFGFLGNPDLRAERATHYNLSVERALGSRTRVVAEVYDREDRDQLFSLSEPRIEAGRLTAEGHPFQNSLDGYARGIELSLQRRSANGLTGWASYSYSKAYLRDRITDLSFASDFDQRHAVNMYGSYRVTETVNLSGQWRYGSGFPRRGFLQQIGQDLFVGAERNLVRLPYYSRLDVRASKAFLFKSWKLTLSGEVLNVLNRDNFIDLRSDPIRFRARGLAFYGITDLMPILPSVGVAFEF